MTEVQKGISFKVCVCMPQSSDICVAFAFQSPVDKKKVLTTQRTFDSEGERQPFVLFSPHFSPHFTLLVSVLCDFLSLPNKHVFLRNSLDYLKGDCMRYSLIVCVLLTVDTRRHAPCMEKQRGLPAWKISNELLWIGSAAKCIAAHCLAFVLVSASSNYR